MNEKIRSFDDQLVQLINNCNLPPSVAYYIIQAKALQIKNYYDRDLYLQKTNKDIQSITPQTEIIEKQEESIQL